MGVAAARAKQVAEQLLGSRESAKEDAKQRAGSLVDEGRRAAADVISALRKEASVLFRDLDHLEEHLRGGKGPAPAPSVSDDVPDDEAARPARKATTARAAAVKKAPAAKATAARKTVPAAKATAGAELHPRQKFKGESVPRPKRWRGPAKRPRPPEPQRFARPAAPPAGRQAGDGPELGARKRLDVELVARGLVPSRAEAAALVSAGRVLVAGAVADKASRRVAPSEPLVVKDLPPRFASRGGEKLDAAVHHFKLDVVGLSALDAGASTGGFTDCLLAHGAAHVVAVDVGHGQLLERLRRDPRMEVVERANVRYLGPADLGGRRFDVVVADLSFISLMMVAPALIALAKPVADSRGAGEAPV